jgi:cyanophycinase
MSALSNRSGGKLFLIGGAAKSCFEHFFELAGGKDSRILLVPHASENWKKNGDALATELRAMGASQVVAAVPSEPFSIPPGTTGIYMLGGDQSELVRLLGERGRIALQRYHRRGGLIAGTSAGAAAQAQLMVTEGMSDGKLVADALKTGRGLGLVRGMMVDTHFMERNRYNRMMAAQFCRKDGIAAVGLDEDTGIIIDGVVATVFGAGCANFFVPSGVFKEKHESKDGAPSRLSVGNVVVSFLSSGGCFDLGSMEPILSAS